MIKHKGYRYRIYPNATQRELIAKTIGCARFVYNHMLAESIAAHKQGERFVNRNAFNYRLTSLKAEYPWLSEADATALTAADDDLADAFSRFFKKQNGFPNYHKKKNGGSYTSKCVNGNIVIRDKHIKLPKLGLVKASIHRDAPPDAIIKSATVRIEPDGRFYVSILYEYDEAVPPVMPASYVGLDYKLDGLYMSSDGETASMPEYFRKAERKLAREQRRLSRKKGSLKGEEKSSNWKKQQRRVNRIHAHVANQRRDFLHKKSSEIANRYDVVCVEDLNMRSMSNKGFGNGKATMDNGYGLFLNMLEYKLADRGKLFVKVDKWFPSSQICNGCGSIHKLELSERTYRCPDCGTVIDRDLNAALNIKDEGLRILRKSA